MRIETEIDALAERGRWFSDKGRLLFKIGLCASPLCSIFYWGSPENANALQSYVRLPAELAAILQSAGAPIKSVPPFLITPGGDLARLTIFPAVLLVLSLVLRKIGVPRVARACLLPFLFIAAYFLMIASPKKERLAARIGTVVDHAGAPAASRDSTAKAPVPPYFLKPDRLPPKLRDQAHYVLAQEAYLEGRPKAVAEHLRALSGASPFPDIADRRVVGILDAHTRAHGLNPGFVAQEISQGAPHYLLNAILWWVVLLASIAALCVGLVFIAIGDSKKATTRKLTATLSKV